MSEFPLCDKDDPRVPVVLGILRKSQFMGGNFTLDSRRILAALDRAFPPGKVLAAIDGQEQAGILPAERPDRPAHVIEAVQRAFMPDAPAVSEGQTGGGILVIASTTPEAAAYADRHTPGAKAVGVGTPLGGRPFRAVVIAPHVDQTDDRLWEWLRDCVLCRLAPGGTLTWHIGGSRG
ncbi:hypothetical protein [Sphaerisporangium sp. NPDC051011]|uniref:hypothetical protein n=1 Tax=Sphaerisporangium sp. NPDC051011 TaxID=3155792 RepID=UPI0033D0F62F